jgi:hypothetical protein
MLPPNVQAYVFQTVSADSDFDGIMNKIPARVSNRAAMEGVPMDVGEVGDEWWSEDWEVDAVGAWTKCHNCEGYGHIARDCPLKKGKGKGKDYHYGNYGKGTATRAMTRAMTRATARGMRTRATTRATARGTRARGTTRARARAARATKGTCWKCWAVGHKTMECTKQVRGDERKPDGGGGIGRRQRVGNWGGEH